MPRSGVCDQREPSRAGTGLLGHLVAQVVPAAQGAGDAAAGAGLTGPATARCARAATERLGRPVEGEPLPEDALERPGDVRAQRSRGGVNEHHPAGRDYAASRQTSGPPVCEGRLPQRPHHRTRRHLPVLLPSLCPMVRGETTGPPARSASMGACSSTRGTGPSATRSGGRCCCASTSASSSPPAARTARCRWSSRPTSCTTATRCSSCTWPGPTRCGAPSPSGRWPCSPWWPTTSTSRPRSTPPLPRTRRSGVPTSYYATVQARVDVEVVDDPDAKADLLTRQLAHFEPAGSVRQPVSTSVEADRRQPVGHPGAAAHDPRRAGQVQVRRQQGCGPPPRHRGRPGGAWWADGRGGAAAAAGTDAARLELTAGRPPARW